jgi:hypothetical protein
MLGALLLLLGAEAQAAVRFVATTGLNTNPCTRTQPCRTLQKGHDVAAAGDEVQVLDSGEFGPDLTITKSITISAVGVSATIFHAPNTAAVTVNAPDGSVVLRGLVINGGGTGFDGVLIEDAAAVHVDRCEIERFVSNGISLTSDDTRLFVSNSFFRDNGSGIFVDAAASFVIDNSRFDNQLDPAIVNSGGEGAVLRTNVSGSAGGIYLVDGTLSVFQTNVAMTPVSSFGYAYFAFDGALTLEECVGRTGSVGLRVAAAGTARISNCILTNNSIGIENDLGGAVLTRGNNTVTGNGVNLEGPVTALPAQ